MFCCKYLSIAMPVALSTVSFNKTKFRQLYKYRLEGRNLHSMIWLIRVSGKDFEPYKFWAIIMGNRSDFREDSRSLRSWALQLAKALFPICME